MDELLFKIRFEKSEKNGVVKISTIVCFEFQGKKYEVCARSPEKVIKKILNQARARL